MILKLCRVQYYYSMFSLLNYRSMDNDNSAVTITGAHFLKQARKAHSSAFCIDLHRQTLMAMMDNDHNDGQ